MKRLFLLLYITMAYVSGLYASSISVDDVKIKAGETKTVVISLNNTQSNLVGFQMDLTLPEGITLNKTGCSLGNRFTDSSQELTIGKQDDGSYRLTSTSLNLKPISGTSGALLTLSVSASYTTAGGEATLKNIIFATSDSKRVTMNDVSFGIYGVTITAKSYTITYGDALPTFEYSSTGEPLAGTPEITCTAGSRPDAGTYDIVVSKGTLMNNSVEYVKGTLTVRKATLTATADNYVKYQGEDNPMFTISYSGFKYNDTETVLSKKPTASCSATKYSPVGTYQITLSGGAAKNYDFVYVSGLLTIKNTTTEFSEGGIKYKVLDFPSKTVAVDKGTYSGHVVIPATVSYDNLTWNVVGLSDLAFSDNAGVITVELPSSLQKNQIGKNVFSNCTALAAITWNGNFQMTDDMLGAVNNKNLLFYANNASYAPASVKNVVVNGTAKEIVLSDAESSNNFYCPKEFTAEKISYSHRYGMTSGYGGKAQGWESIALPFTVSEITHESKGKLLPFGAWTSTSDAKPFWLCKLNSSGFSRATTIEANTPYIICMPNNGDRYDEEYCLSGNVTFSATKAKVLASNSVNESKSNSKTFIPAFCAQDKSSTVYALNVNNSYHSELGGYTEGSAFVSDLRKVSPFEAYITTSAANAKRAFLIDFSETTGIDEIPTTDMKDGTHKIYNLNGQLVKQTKSQQELDETLKQLPAGVYVVNGKKTIVKR